MRKTTPRKGSEKGPEKGTVNYPTGIPFQKLELGATRATSPFLERPWDKT
jgi:hypothetical protein